MAADEQRRPAPGVRLAPLGLPADDVAVIGLRRFVRANRSLQAGFLYRRSAVDADAVELRPAVGLLAAGRALGTSEVASVRAAVGEVHGHDVDVVALDQVGLPAVVAVAPPIGAGGDLEDASVALRQRAGRSRPATLLLAATFADAVVVVPAPGDGEPRALQRADRLVLPRLLLEGTPVVPAFSSPLALLHTAPPHPGGVQLPGSALTAAVPEGVEIALDPGCPTAAVISTALVRQLSGRHPVPLPDA